MLWFVLEFEKYLASKRRELQILVEPLQKKNDKNANLGKYKTETWCLCLVLRNLLWNIFYWLFPCFSVLKVTDLYNKLRNIEQERLDDNTASLTIASKCLVFFHDGWIHIISIWSYNSMIFSRAEGGAEDQNGGADSWSSFHPG